MAAILTPGYLRWDGTKYVLDEDVEIVGPVGPAGAAGSNGAVGPPGPSTGPASGDLSGNYPNPRVVKIQNNPITPQSLGASQDGYVLTWDNTNGFWQSIAPVPAIYGGSNNGGSGVVLWKNAITPPTSNPTGGSIIYEGSGTLKQRGSGGVTTDVAPAGNGTVNSQAAVINRVVAFLRTNNTSANTIYTYTVPYSVTVGAFTYIEIQWTARDTSGSTSMIAGAGRSAAVFSCSTGGTLAQPNVSGAGTNQINTNFSSSTGTFNKNFNLLTFDNITGNRFVTNASGSAFSYTTAASGVINIQVTPASATNIDWTADIYIQVN